MIQKKDITTIILAGGKSSRMGTDKGLIDLNGKSFMDRIIRAAKPLTGATMIVSNDAKYDLFETKRVSDIIPNTGPLGGIFSGLFYSESDINLILSCDVPMINTAVLTILMENYDADKDVIQIQSEGKNMPLIGLYKKRCMHAILEALKGGERRLTKVVGELTTKTIPLDSKLELYVRNINTQEELKQLKHELEH